MTEGPRSYRTEALVIRHSNFGEADRILTLFSREQGKVRAIAKGIRKLKSRKAGHLEPFTRVLLQLARGRDLLIVTQAETVEAYLNIRASLEVTAQAAYVLEILERFTFDEEENRELYQLAVEALQRLDSGVESFYANRYYEMHVLNALGFKPELFACVICREVIQPVDQYFSAAQGGVVCPKCIGKVEGAHPISVDALRFLRHFQRSDFKEAVRANPEFLVRGEMEDLLQHYISIQLDRRLNTPGFIRAIHHTE
ncbi:MAG: DNA repair protein RecO [Anaerolinea sp.]|nr:DNA repair protein RecO [Anaerolinea sp.]